MEQPRGTNLARQIKPPFAYYGGKTKLATDIAALLPPHAHYVEPFAGSLAVLLAKAQSKQETVNDLDGDLMTFWRILRDRPDELERQCVLTPHGRAEYWASRDLDTPDDLERARRVFVRLTQGRSHSMRPTGWWFSRAHDNQSPADKTLSHASRIPNVARRIRSVTLEARDALDVIRDYGAEPDVCIYMDPPYLGSTRATNYRHEMLTDDAHTEFAEAVNACKAAVVISGYDSPLYAELFPGWHVTRMKGATTLSGATDRTEVLWSNTPLGQQAAFDFTA